MGVRVIAAGMTVFHATDSRSKLTRLRGPMWLAKSRGHAGSFGRTVHTFETTRALRLWPLESAVVPAPGLPLDMSIFLPRDRVIAAVRAAGYDGTVLYAGDPSEEIMLLEPKDALRRIG